MTSVSGPAPVGPLFDTNMSPCGGNGVFVPAAAASFSEFGSVVDATFAMLVNAVPGGVAGGMWKVNVKFAVLPAVNVAIEQVMVPTESPKFGVAQLNDGPLSCEAETNVSPVGMASVSVTRAESSGPMFVTPTLYETSVSAAASDGPNLVTRRSASCA